MLDINDNPPRFTRDEYGVSLTENIDIVAVSVTASDIDEGTNADITYELIDGNTNNAFVIGKLTNTTWLHLSLPSSQTGRREYCPGIPMLLWTGKWRITTYLLSVPPTLAHLT